VCDASKLRRITGWQPRRDLLAETLPDLLESWRERIQKEATRGV
jgi:nucleoside-diphosphate-sugar epimerase